MYAYVCGDLIQSTKYWSGAEVKDLALSLESLLRAPARVTAFAVSQGDTFQFECAAVHALRVALLFELSARAAGKPGARVAFAFQTERPNPDLPITLHAGPAYTAAGRGVGAVKSTPYHIYYATTKPEEAGWMEAVKACGLLIARLTARQAEVLKSFIHSPAIEQSGISTQLGISQQAVSKHMRAGYMKQIAGIVAAFESHAALL